MAAPLFGWISDTWGRLVALGLSLVLVSVSGAAGAFTGSAWGLVGRTEGLVLYTVTRSHRVTLISVSSTCNTQVHDGAGGHGLLHDQLRLDGGACQPQVLHDGRDR